MKKVVSATLAGALAVGMVPAMALADESVDMLVAGEIADTDMGTVTEAEDNEGNSLDLEANITFTAGDDELYVVPTEVVTHSGEVVKPEKGQIRYYRIVAEGTANASGSDDLSWLEEGEYVTYINTASGIKDADFTVGEYYVTVGADNSGVDEAVAVKFAVQAKSLEGAYLVAKVIDEGTEDQAFDTVFEYTGEAYSFDEGIRLVSADGDVLEKDVDYTATWVGNVGRTDVGTYTLRIAGINDYETAGKTKDVQFTIVPRDLSKANVGLNVAEYAIASADEKLNADVTTVDDIDFGDDVVLTYVKDSNGAYTVDPQAAAGTYTYTLAAADADNENFTGAKTVEVVRYAEEAVFKYDGTDFSGTTTFATLDTEEGAVFDESAIKVVDESPKADVPFVVTYLKEDATAPAGWAEVSQAATPGNYQAVITVDSAKAGYAYGGVATITFTIDSVEVDGDAGVFVYYDGKLTQGVEVAYDGSDVLEKIAVEVFDADEEALAEGSDWKVKVTTKVNGKTVEVDEVVNAGEYTFEVVPAADSMYAFKTGTNVITIEVADVDNSDNARVRLAGAPTLGWLDDAYAYTGEAVVPEFEYDLTAADDNGKHNEVANWIALPATAYTVKYYEAEPVYTYYDEDGEEVDSTEDWTTAEITDYEAGDALEGAPVEVGEYIAKLTDVAADGNYKIAGEVYFQISDEKVFADVQPTDWFYNDVYEVFFAGWMKGYGNSNSDWNASFFGPNASLKRGDAAVALFRFAGHTLDADDGQIDSINGYDTGFGDVDAMKYWAEAILWAKESGIMGGYTDGSGDFGPADFLTREQMATILFRYATISGEAGKAAAADLSGYADADEISAFAQEGVEWCVANNIFGVGVKYLDPTDEVTRAEFAAMLNRFAAFLNA